LRLLLDTHTVLWFAEDSPKLTAASIRAIEDPKNEILLSTVVPWEIAIKRALGKLETSDDYLRLLRDAGVGELPVTIPHAQAVEHLPQHHGDPFDRLLIAQAQVENAAIVTDDSRIRKYDVATVW
jgi:PIN domain nuclease of toxin-antitoxin system